MKENVKKHVAGLTFFTAEKWTRAWCELRVLLTYTYER